jgi:surface protein
MYACLQRGSVYRAERRTEPVGRSKPVGRSLPGAERRTESVGGSFARTLRRTESVGPSLPGAEFGADAFNQDISGWDVSSVTAAFGMFRSADAFDQDLCDWGTGPMGFQAWVPVVRVNDMFLNANCDSSPDGSTADPVLTASPPRPFCRVCTL